MGVIICLTLGWAGNDVFNRYKIGYFNLDKDVNIIDILTFLATIFLAYYIPSVLSKRDQNTRIEKDFIINKINECSSMIELLIKTVRSNSINYQDAASSIQDIVLLFSRINRYSLTAGILVEDNIVLIKQQVRQLRALITGSLTTAQIADYTAKNIEIPIVVSNNIIQFSNVRIREIMQEDIILERHVFDLIILINRAI